MPVFDLQTEVINVDFADENHSVNRLTSVNAKQELVEEGKEDKKNVAKLDISAETIRKYISTTEVDATILK